MIDEEQFMKDMESIEDYVFSFKKVSRRKKLNDVYNLLKIVASSYELKRDFMRKIIYLEEFKDFNHPSYFVRNLIKRLEGRKILKLKLLSEGRSKLIVEAGEYFDVFFKKLAEIIHDIDMEAQEKIKEKLVGDGELHSQSVSGNSEE